MNNIEISTNNEQKVLQLIKHANNILRDSEGGSSLERFDNIVKLIVLKVIDELEIMNSQKSEPDLTLRLFETEEDLYKRISTFYYNSINVKPLNTIFTEKFKSFPTDMHAVNSIIKLWEKNSFNEAFFDIKGVAFQEILKNTFDKNDNQQFFTPTEIADFLSKIASLLVQDRKKVKIADPAVGTGGLLIHFLFNSLQSNQNISFSGIDIDERMSWLANINLYLSSAINFNVYHISGGGSLDKEKSSNYIQNEFFDLIITNPPFGSEVTNKTILSQYSFKNLSSKRRSTLFIERCIELLKEDGYLVIIVDDSILNSTQNSEIRKFINETCQIISVISLPNHAFQPYASVKTSILILKKITKEINEDTDILMVNISNTGRKSNGEILYKKERINGVRVIESDLSECLNIFNSFLRKEEIFSSLLSWKISLSSLKLSAKEDGYNDWQYSRLDTTRYHPLLLKAYSAIENTDYPKVKIKDVVNVRNDKVVPSLFPEKEFNFISLSDIEKNNGLWTFQRVFGDSIKSSQNKFKPHDIIFSKMRPNLRKVAYINKTIDGICSSECLVIYINEKFQNQILPEFLCWVMKNDIFYGQILSKVTGIGRPRVSTSSILNCEIPLPHIDKQNEIVLKYEKALDNYMTAQNKALKLLTTSENEFAKNVNSDSF